MATKQKAGTKPAERKSASAAKNRPAKKPKAGKRAVAKKAHKPTAKKPAMLRKIAFTMLSVTDPARARRFYEETLGLTRGLASGDGVWTEYDLPGGGCLALFCHPNPKLNKPPGGSSVAFEVADLDALNERLRGAGVEYEGDMVHGPNCRMSNIKDSEGNSLILHQLNHR